MSAVLPVDPAVAYLLVSDVTANARHSTETKELTWVARAHPARVTVGDRFTARNSAGNIHWTSASVVTRAEPGRVFSFAVSGTEHPTAIWTFLLEPATEGSTRVTYQVVLGDGPSMFQALAHADPTLLQAVVCNRLDQLADGMNHLLHALAHHVDQEDAQSATSRPSYAATRHSPPAAATTA